MNKQKGHEGDVERLIEEHQPQLKAFIHRRVSSKEDAEDILQDVCLLYTSDAADE